MAAARQRSATAQVEDSRRAGGKELDNARQGNFVFAMQFRDREPKRGFESSDAKGRALELDLLFVAACGAWSVAMASTVPSASATMMASRSAAERSGGFIL